MVNNKKKGKSQYAATESLYNPDGGQSVKTINESNDHQYVGLSGAATLDLSNKGSKQVVYLEGSRNK